VYVIGIFFFFFLHRSVGFWMTFGWGGDTLVCSDAYSFRSAVKILPEHLRLFFLLKSLMRYPIVWSEND
jgi:hypothetical protein